MFSRAKLIVACLSLIPIKLETSILIVSFRENITPVKGSFSVHNYTVAVIKCVLRFFIKFCLFSFIFVLAFKILL